MIVVDSSVAFKWFKPENNSDQANKLLQNHLNGINHILVPPLLFLEIANALVAKTLTTPPTIRQDLQHLYTLDLHLYTPTLDNLLETAQLAKKYHTSVYYMLYAVIAKYHHTTLITADANFLKKTRFRFVKLLGSS